MAFLGKCLLFYLKYPTEMDRLYEADNSKFDGLPNPEELKEKIKRIGDAADKEAEEFLEIYTPGILARFRAISSVRRKRNTKFNYEIQFRVATRRAVERHFWIGVAFNTDRTSLIPWVWSRGGRRAADELIRILGCGEKAEKFGWSNGTVALTEIKIHIPDRFDEPVECDSLVKQVHEAFELFTAQHVKAIAAIATK